MRDTFSDYHPIVNFFYFILMLLFTMFWMHPVSLVISFFGAMTYLGCLRGWQKLKRQLLFLFPMMLFAAILNPAFNHEGNTIITYVPSGNPLTLESLVYGVAASVLLAAAVLWCSCLGTVMTTDKLIYLFGRIAPSLSLLLSMTLRFVPRFTAQLHSIVDSQRCLGRDIAKGSVLERLKTAVIILSILITWALENAVHIADSMNSRGYGLPGRTAFSIYNMKQRDKWLLAWLIICGLILIYGWLAGKLACFYYPTIQITITPLSWLFHGTYLFLSITPVFLHRREVHLWKRLQSEI